MPQINFEINFLLTWFAKALCSGCRFINSSYQLKLIPELKLRLKRTVNWNKYQFKLTTQAQNQDLDYLIDSNF